MKTNKLDTIIKFNIDNDGNISINDVAHNKFAFLSEKDPNDVKLLTDKFNELSNSDIREIKYLNNDKIMVIANDNGSKGAVQISNYSLIKNKKYFKSMKKTILEYELAKMLYHLSQKTKSKSFKLSLALSGSLIAVATVITVSKASEVYKAEAIDITEAIQTITQETKEVDDIQIDEKEGITVNYFDIESIKEYNDNPVPISSKNDEVLSFDDLKNFGNYDDYIRFASKLYYVDYNEAKRIVEEKFSTFQNSNHSELKRMHDLKEKGIINGDLNVIGIFITIKDYAIDKYMLDSEEPIKSNKTEAEREKDLISVAQNIYGIDNIDLLNCIVAIHRVETGNGIDKITKEKNNLGGNLSAKYQEKIVVNVYKTNEIGAESMIRNFLNVYNKCLYDERCNYSDSTPVFMSKLYCTHTPEEWAVAVTDKINNGSVKDDVSTYLNSDMKTY